MSGTWEGAIALDAYPLALSVSLRHSAQGWAGTFSIPSEGVSKMPLPDVTVAGDSVVLVFRPGFVFRGVVSGDSIAGAVRDGSGSFPGVFARPGTPTAERLAAEVRRAIDAARNRPLVEAAHGPGAARVDARALDRLIRAAAEAHSDAVVILHDGELVGAWYAGGERRKIEAMSATKSIVNLAIGRLVTTGAIASIDVPVHTFYPEWNHGRKAKITIRHLLNHTSGMQADRTTEEIYASPDFVRLALDAEITSEPGTEFFYNNKAVNLLAGIVEKASGKRMDLFLRDDLFAKLGITDFGWSLDRAGIPTAWPGSRSTRRTLRGSGSSSSTAGGGRASNSSPSGGLTRACVRARRSIPSAACSGG
ncbi:MAG TPA: serine hydrolase domain-containing protein [Longimicrobiales bacterium]